MLEARLQQARAERDDALLARDSAEAVADTTRERFLRALRENASWYERRVVQVRDLVEDSLDRELRQEVALRAEVELRFDSLRAVAGATSDEEEGARVSTFLVRQEPLTANVEVRMPPPPDSASLVMDFALDPLRLEARVGCRGDGPLREATLGLRAPEWARVEVGRVEQEATVCNPQMETPDPGWWERNDQWVGMGLGITVAEVLRRLLFRGG